VNANADSAISTTNACKPPRWFWVVAVLALLWYLMDASAFFMRVSMSDETIASMPTDQQHLYRDMPLWVDFAFACEVFGGTLGCIALLMLKRWAWLLFVVSLLGTLAQTTNIWFLTDAISVMGTPAIAMPIVAMVIAVAMIILSIPRPNTDCSKTSTLNQNGG
jgi:hypothetical protein